MLPVVMVLLVCTSPGQTFGVAVFNPYIKDSLGLTSGQLSGAYMAGTLLASLPLIWVGVLMDRYGLTRVLFAVVILFGLTCISMKFVSNLTSLFFVFFFLRLLGQGSLSMLARNALAMWFDRRLGFASGLSNVGMSLAVGAVPALGITLINSYGWRSAYALLGIGLWIVILPLLIFVFKDSPDLVGENIDGKKKGIDKEDPSKETYSLSMSEVIRTKSFWIINACMASWSMSGTATQFHIVSIFSERGLGEIDVALMFSVFALISAIGRIAGGILADLLPQHIMVVLAMVLQGIGLSVLNLVVPLWLPYVFGVVSGLGSSLALAVSETVWVRYYGRRHLGKIRGTTYAIGVAASGIGPFFMGVCFDLMNSFVQFVWVCAILSVILAVLALFAVPPRS
tara:strand:- start:2560 stop:3750 length:1191 start_codon:yes stop_codon:yes gene_type:complete